MFPLHRYLVDCPGDLIPALYMVGTKAKAASKEFSSGEWPVSGGVDSAGASAGCSYAELVLTGHADGSLRFWDASSTSMQSLHRLKTVKYFERAKGGGGDNMKAELDENPYAITHAFFCGESRDLAVAGAAGQVLLFRFKKKETATETKSMEIPIVYEVSSQQQQTKTAGGGGGGGGESSPPSQQHFEFPAPKPLLNVASQSASYTDPVDGFNFDKPQYEYFSPLKVRTGVQRKAPGFHAEVACLTPWVNGEKPSPISCLVVNAAYGLMAYGNGSGLAVIDYVQGVCLLNMGTADLYGCLDPFQRLPRSPKPLDLSAKPEIVRVDLGSYSQVDPSTPGKENSVAGPGQEKEKLQQKDSMALPTPSSRAGDRVKSPDCKRLQKGGSSTDAENNLSKSSSASSLTEAAISAEGVTCLHFADAFAAKNDFTLGPCLHVGTSLGSVLTIVVSLPEEPKRADEPVVVSPSGSLFRLRGRVLTTCFLDCSAGSLLSHGRPAENVKVPAKGGPSPTPASAAPQSTVSQSSAAASASTPGGLTSQDSQDKSSPPPSFTSSSSSGDQEVMVVCTEKAAAVYALPSQRQMHSQTIGESSNVVRASVVNFGGSGARFTPSLVCYTACGHIKVYSIPTLRPLFETYFAARSDRIDTTLAFSDFGHGLYFCNQNELQKITLSREFFRQLPEMQGSVFQVCKC